jgi:hypothetical protein
MLTPQMQTALYGALAGLARLTLMRLASIAAVGIAMALASGHALAGRACEQKAPTAESLRDGLALAHKVAIALDESRAEAALIGRIGQDLTRHGLTYSHAGVVLRDPERGGYTVVSLLNHCGTADSAIYDDGLGSFFMDDLFRHEALLIIPSLAAQAKLRQAVTSGDCHALHTPLYNVAQYPFSTQYQNCNGWLLECLAVAAGTARDRASAQRWAKRQDFVPTTLRLSTLERLGGRITSANVAFDDHPDARRFSGRIDVASVEAVFTFFRTRVDQNATSVEVRL